MAVTVKICGIRTADDARAAFESGADFAGLVFWPQSARVLDPERAGEIVHLVPGRYVGVFKDVSWTDLKGVLSAVPLWGAQLHGKVPDEWIARVHELGISAISTHEDEAGADIWLMDGPTAGSGIPWDWALPERKGRTFWLAGGLSPDNVGALVRRLCPDGVDVSTGVEHNGRKDLRLMQRFIKEAKGWPQ